MTSIEQTNFENTIQEQVSYEQVSYEQTATSTVQTSPPRRLSLTCAPFVLKHTAEGQSHYEQTASTSLPRRLSLTRTPFDLKYNSTRGSVSQLVLNLLQISSNNYSSPSSDERDGERNLSERNLEMYEAIKVRCNRLVEFYRAFSDDVNTRDEEVVKTLSLYLEGPYGNGQLSLRRRERARRYQNLSYGQTLRLIVSRLNWGLSQLVKRTVVFTNTPQAGNYNAALQLLVSFSSQFNWELTDWKNYVTATNTTYNVQPRTFQKARHAPNQSSHQPSHQSPHQSLQQSSHQEALQAAFGGHVTERGDNGFRNGYRGQVTERGDNGFRGGYRGNNRNNSRGNSRGNTGGARMGRPFYQNYQGHAPRHSQENNQTS